MTYPALQERLAAEIPIDRLLTDPLRTLAYGTDASFYRLVPKLVVKVESESEVRAVLRECRAMRIPLTFRAAGTSLSGQALSDSVLMMLGPEGFRQCNLNADRSQVTLGAGVLGAEANRFLAPYGKKIGPDPASINSAKIGGIVSNNACGMSSGTSGNSMGTVHGMRIIFADGTILDTRDEDSRRAFRQRRPNIIERIEALAADLRADLPLVERIRTKYAIKNTTGYSLNALIDYDDPIDVIQHLMIGSEGTLGFIAEVSFRTLEESRHKATALMLFPDIARACEAVWHLKACSVSAAELMDRTALRSVQGKPGMPAFIAELDDAVTALLVETAADTPEELRRQTAEIETRFQKFPLAHAFEFSSDPQQAAALWNIRKGLFPSACIGRPKGTAVIIEDIAVPIEHLRGCLLDLQGLFQRFDYEGTIIWGHVFDGNVHFVLTPDFTDSTEIAKYKNFMEAVVALVVDKYDGSLKAEHGTGRNMAPFVRREWGDRLYEIMREIKATFDPEGLLNPGVIINDDPEAHLKHVKAMPPAHDSVDACIECGFCERSCMSHDMTLSARQRIVAYREMTRLAASGEDRRRLTDLRRRFAYDGDRTCAADGLCAQTCPVDIDTGRLIKVLRAENLGPLAGRIGDFTARHLDRVTAVGRLGLGLLDRLHGWLGTPAMTRAAGKLRAWSGNRLPLWTQAMPRPAIPAAPRAGCLGRGDRVVYFPSCINRTMGPARGSETEALPRRTALLLHKAGYEVCYPPRMESLCCGMPFASKGMTEPARKKAAELEKALLQASDGGRIPILCDMSPCLHHMRQTLDTRLQLFEPIRFTLDYLVDRLEFEKISGPVAIHTVCSAKLMDLEDDLHRLAAMCAEQVIAPDILCCGFAGDRGFTVPELNAFGLRHLKAQLPSGVREGFSTSRTCEIGLSTHSGVDYKSIVYLVDRCTRPKSH